MNDSFCSSDPRHWLHFKDKQTQPSSFILRSKVSLLRTSFLSVSLSLTLANRGAFGAPYEEAPHRVKEIPQLKAFLDLFPRFWLHESNLPFLVLTLCPQRLSGTSLPEAEWDPGKNSLLDNYKSIEQKLWKTLLHWGKYTFRNQSSYSACYSQENVGLWNSQVKVLHSLFMLTPHLISGEFLTYLHSIKPQEANLASTWPSQWVNVDT